MSRIFGYCIELTRGESIESQQMNIKKLYPEVILVNEVFNDTRIAWKQLYEGVKDEDTIVFDSIVCLGSDANECWANYRELFNRGVEIVFTKQQYINSATYRQSLVDSGIKIKEKIKLKGVNEYVKVLLEKQIRIAFEQAEKEVKDL